MLEAEHIPVSLLVTTEPNRISHKVPRNVERYINIFQANSLLGGFNTETVPGFRGHIATFDLAKHSEVSHVNMEKDGAIQEQVMNKILELDASSTSPIEAIRNTWDVPAGPSGLGLDDQAHLVVWSAFDRVLTLIDRVQPDVFSSVSPTAARPPTPYEVGRKLFFASGDPRIASDGRACASCHPDGRDDTLVWSSAFWALMTLAVPFMKPPIGDSK